MENFGVRKLEFLFCVFIGIMGLSFAWMFGKTNPDVKAVASGALTFARPYLTLRVSEKTSF